MSKKDDTAAGDRFGLNAMREITEALYREGYVTDEHAARSQALRAQVGAKPLKLERGTFDASAIVPAPVLGPEEIKALREREGASQAVLAMHLGIATATLSQWESGRRKPDGPALRLLSLIERHGLGHVR